MLEVVYDKKKTFWLYACLLETFLPLNFYTNTLYPQAFCEYTKLLMEHWDTSFYQ